jgi:hypothetical protein
MTAWNRSWYSRTASSWPPRINRFLVAGQASIHDAEDVLVANVGPHVGRPAAVEVLDRSHNGARDARWERESLVVFSVPVYGLQLAPDLIRLSLRRVLRTALRTSVWPGRWMG